MANGFKRWWGYLKAKTNRTLEERADPKIQLEQAIREAQDQHRRLREQAANVIANRNQAEMRLNRALGELEKVNANARQALLMADEAEKRGDAKTAEQYVSAAEALANRMIQLERDIEDLKAMSLQSAQAAEQARQAVEQNARQLQQKLAERQQLLSQLDQAKMQEEMTKALAVLNEEVGQAGPTFEEVRQKIEARYAKAKGAAELTESSVQSRMREIEAATASAEARSRLSAMKVELGLASGPTPEELLAAAAPSSSDDTADAEATEATVEEPPNPSAS
jgi:phage shock protein A